MENYTDRKLNQDEYLQIIQREYIIAEFRLNIYKNEKDRIFYTRLLENKRLKIEKIHTLYNRATILNNKDIKQKYYQEFYNSRSMPIFEGADKKDFKYYFYKDSDVFCCVNGTYKQAKIINGFIIENKIIVDIDGVEQKIEIQNVQRIFNFLNF